MPMTRRLLMRRTVGMAVALGSSLLPWRSSTAASCPQLLEVGWNTPEVIDLPTRIAAMEAQAPFFDGMVLDLLSNVGIATGRRDTNVHCAWLCYGPAVLARSDYSQAIAALMATPFQRYRANLLKLTTRAATHDLFSPVWESVTIPNMELLARLAQETGCTGLWFDTEEYDGGRPFSSTWQLHRFPPTRPQFRRFPDYQARSQALGTQVMQAFQRGFPGLDVLLTFGYKVCADKVNATHPLDTVPYNLLPAFLDGMLEVSPHYLYDGYEQAYGFGSERMFQSALSNWAIDAWSRSSQRHKYRIGFGLWVDYASHWDNVNAAANYFQPMALGQAVQWGLHYTDKYVWLYSERPNWYDGSMPQAYGEALRRSRA